MTKNYRAQPKTFLRACEMGSTAAARQALPGWVPYSLYVSININHAHAPGLPNVLKGNDSTGGQKSQAAPEVSVELDTQADVSETLHI